MSTDATPHATSAPQPEQPSAEFQLIARAQQGEVEAFEALYAQYKKRVYSICVLMTGNATEAEDLAQEAFVRVFRRLSTFRGDSAFSTWLHRVVVNTVLMNLRKHGLQQVSYDNPLALDQNTVERDFGRTDSQLAGTIDRIALARAIKELPNGYRTVFILHDVQGYEHHEIARMLECSLGTSKSQLHKARLRVRSLLLATKKVNGKTATHARPQAEAASAASGAVQVTPRPAPPANDRKQPQALKLVAKSDTASVLEQEAKCSSARF